MRPRAATALPRGGGLAPKRGSYRPYDCRGTGAEWPRRRRQRGRDEHSAYARRALAAVASDNEPAAAYMVTDVQILPKAVGRARCVVYLQQRFLGLPVYDGRRAVVFTGRLIEKTGRWIPVRSLPKLVPGASAESAIRRAFTHVFGGRCSGLKPAYSFGSAERFEAFRCEGLSIAAAHLTVFAGRGARLAWVVDLARDGGSRFELVLDAETLAVLGRRELSQAASVSLTLARRPGTVDLFFEPAWRTSGAVAVEFRNARWTPPQPVAGIIRGTENSDIHSLNAFTLANRAFDVLARFMPAVDPPLARMRVFTATVTAESEAAKTIGRDIVLRGVKGTPARFAVLDPSVVVHEVGHVVLNAIVGGRAFPHPFEVDGESAAVSEGLADFLGLTIWNGICRSLTAGPAEEEVFGSSFLGQPRDYRGYLAGDGPKKVGPGIEPHREGMFLCGALLQGRAHLIDENDLDEDAADETLWSALGAGLPALPHERLLPNFCCVRRVVLDNLSASLRAVVDEAFEEVGLEKACGHFR